MFQLKSRKYSAGFPAQRMGGHPLLDAAWNRDAEAFAQEAGDEEDIGGVEDELGNDSLIVAAYRGAVDIVAFLVERQSMDAATSRNHQGWTPMHFAAYRGWTSVVEYFIERAGNEAGSLVTKGDLNGYTPFHIAADMNQVHIIELFLSRKLPMDVVSPSCATPIVLACRENHVQIAQLLASAGADICRKSTLHDGLRHQTPLLLASQHGWGEQLRAWGAVPGKPPAPTILKMTHDETKVGWIAPPGRSAPVDSYDLQVRRVHRLLPEAEWITVATDVRERVHTFYTCSASCSAYSRPKVSEDLDPGCAYIVRVFAKSLVGTSEPSEPSVLFMTAPGTPAKPAPPEITFTSNVAVTFEWTLPDDNGAPIDKSQLQWKLVHSPYGEWSTVPEFVRVAKCDSDYESISESSDTDDEPDPDALVQKQRYTLTNLAPGHRYRCRVRCHNCIGWSFVSEPSEIAFTRTQQGGRRQGFADTMRSGEERMWAQGTDPHAEARFLSMLRVHADAVQCAENEKQWARDSERSVVHRRASIVLQSAWRRHNIQRDYETYLKTWKASERILCEYGTENQFKTQWCAKVMRHVDVARERREKAQTNRARRRRLKQEHLSRKEARQLKRKLRQLAAAARKCAPPALHK